ncbi:unnamed protein product [Coccothraustes coccothraustes]
MLLPSKPLLPIPKRSSSPKLSKIFHGEQESGKPGTGWDHGIRHKQLTSEGNGTQTSLPYASGGGEMKKGSLGLPLIPPICKAGSLPVVGSAAGSVCSSPQLDLLESREMRPKSSSISQEKPLEHAGELCNLQPVLAVGQHGIFGGLKSARDLQEPLLPFQGLPLSQAKETDHPTSAGLTRDKELRDGSGKVRAALGQLAQKNLEWKKMVLLERAMKRRQKETSLQLPPKAVEPRDAAEGTFRLPPVDGAAPSVEKKQPGSAMKKKVMKKQDNVPLLPSTPTLPGDGSFPCSSSVTSQAPSGAKRREELLRRRGQKDSVFSDPQKSLEEALSMLGSDDWELKEKGLFNIPCLAESHPEVLLGRLREICLAVTSEVTNLRSKVSCSAITTLGELFVILKKDMDSEADEVAAVLLHMVQNPPEFVQKAACQTLGIMVENMTPARAMTVLMDKGVKNRYVLARKCAAELLLSLVEKMGVTKLAGTPRAERLAQVAGTLAQDCHKDTRHYGQEMVKMLLNNQKFKKLLEQSLSPHDLEDILTRIKKKGMENQKSECPSVKEPVKERKDGSKEPQAIVPTSKRVKSAPGGRLLHCAKAQVMSPAAVEGRESLQKLYHLLEAKEFQTRMEGVALLLDLCRTRPQLISSNIVQIFDYFILRINDTHKKVKQKALEVLAEMTGLLEDALNPVMVRLVEGITKNLNSKDLGVHAAAVNALDRTVVHLDEVSLMKELSHQWSQLSGEALLEVMECITVLVEWVYARSPEAVQRYALPVLWSCLENKALPVRSANVWAKVTKLACALCEVMGAQLIKCAESKPPHVQENLSSLLGW